jgi:anti-sigma-K factor RskA
LNIQEYIASGAIETYVLGMASKKEQAEFERLCAQFPELKKARIDFELHLEQKALSNAITPPSSLKERIFETIRQESAVQSANEIIGHKHHTIVKTIPRMKWAIAASVIVLLGFGSFVYFLYNKNKELETEVARSKNAIEKIKQQSQAIESSELPENSTVQQVKVETPKNIPATIHVFWDSTNTNVYLVIRDLIKLPSNQKYQLWSINKGKYTSLGLFDAPNDDRLILKLNNSQDAEAFSISIADLSKIKPEENKPPDSLK